MSGCCYGLLVCAGAVEKQKLAYILNRDTAARLTISSPLEAHKAHTLVYHMVGVDVGFDNPMFACIELDYEVRGGGGGEEEVMTGLLSVYRKQMVIPPGRQLRWHSR